MAQARLRNDETTANRPKRGWTALIDGIRTGQWTNPKSGEWAPSAPNEMIVIEEDLDGAEPDLACDAGLLDDLAAG